LLACVVVAVVVVVYFFFCSAAIRNESSASFSLTEFLDDWQGSCGSSVCYVDTHTDTQKHAYYGVDTRYGT